LSVTLGWFLDSIRGQIDSFENRKELEKISHELPGIFEEHNNIEPKDPQFSEFIACLLIKKIEFNNGMLNLRVGVHNMNIARDICRKNEKINLLEDHGMSQVWLMAIDDNYEIIGAVKDPLKI
jgi:hypothetical protein